VLEEISVMREGRDCSIVVLLTLSIFIATTVAPTKAEEEYHVIATLQAPTLTERGHFGSDLALFEDTLLIAEWFAAQGDISQAGKAYIFDSDWNLVTTFQDPNPEEGQYFSRSVDLKSDMAAIPCYKDLGSDWGRVGNISLFNFEGTLLNTIQPPERVYWSRFGATLCFYGDLLLVSESQKDDLGVLDSGVLHVFNTEGDLLHTIHSLSPITKGHFGESIDANEEFILVGESGNWWEQPINNGSVYVYNREYELVETLHSPDHQERTYFGMPVAISENIFVVGEHWASVDGHEKAGRAHLYDNDLNLVATLESPTPEDNGEFGFHVAIGGGLVVVGERKGDVVSMSEGKAYVFDLEGNLIDTLVSPEPEIGAQFGWRVVTDGEIIVVAEVEHSADGVSKAGKVNVFGLEEPAVTVPVVNGGGPRDGGGIPGFPYESIVIGILVGMVLWLKQRQR
jgi:hypothetical protein